MPTPSSLRRALDELSWLDEVEDFELAWPSPPSMDLSKEGHAFCAVRSLDVPTPSGGRGPCLVREFDLRPTRQNSQSLTAAAEDSGAPAKERRPLQLRVHERDLRRCSGDVQLLKRCDLDGSDDSGDGLAAPAAPQGLRRSSSNPCVSSRRSSSSSSSSSSSVGSSAIPGLPRWLSADVAPGPLPELRLDARTLRAKRPTSGMSRASTATSGSGDGGRLSFSSSCGSSPGSVAGSRPGSKESSRSASLSSVASFASFESFGAAGGPSPAARRRRRSSSRFFPRL